MHRHIKPEFPRDDKYLPFVRTDFEIWSYWKALFTHIFFLPRFIFCWISLTMCAISVFLLSLGRDKSKPLDGFRYDYSMLAVRTSGLLILLGGGVLTLPKKRANVDYTHYLGPDWKPTFTGAGISVSNHSSFMDIIVVLANIKRLGFVTKMENRKVPAVGYLTESIGCLFIERGGTKE